MRRLYRTVAIAFFLCAAQAALAQTTTAARNSLARDGANSPFSNALGHSAPLNTSSGIGRPVTRYGPVTPVPEPSEWLMLLAGLGVVGVIARRAAKRS